MTSTSNIASTSDNKTATSSSTPPKDMAETNHGVSSVETEHIEQELVKVASHVSSSVEEVAESNDTDKNSDKNPDKKSDPKTLRKHAKEHHDPKNCEICAGGSESKGDYVVDLSNSDMDFWENAQKFLMATANDEPIIVVQEDGSPGLVLEVANGHPNDESDPESHDTPSYNKSMGFYKYQEPHGFCQVEDSKFEPVLNVPEVKNSDSEQKLEVLFSALEVSSSDSEDRSELQSNDSYSERETEPESIDPHSYDESMGFCKYKESQGFFQVEDEDFRPLLNGQGNFRFYA